MRVLETNLGHAHDWGDMRVMRCSRLTQARLLQQFHPCSFTLRRRIATGLATPLVATRFHDPMRRGSLSAMVIDALLRLSARGSARVAILLGSVLGDSREPTLCPSQGRITGRDPLDRRDCERMPFCSRTGKLIRNVITQE